MNTGRDLCLQTTCRIECACSETMISEEVLHLVELVGLDGWSAALIVSRLGQWLVEVKKF